MEDAWQPDENSLDWTRSLIEKLNDGGAWVVPATGGVYVIDKQNKKLTLINNMKGPMHDRIVKAFSELGYVVDAIEDHMDNDPKTEGTDIGMFFS